MLVWHWHLLQDHKKLLNLPALLLHRCCLLFLNLIMQLEFSVRFLGLSGSLICHAQSVMSVRELRFRLDGFLVKTNRLFKIVFN